MFKQHVAGNEVKADDMKHAGVGFATTTGAADAYVATFSEAITAYVTGMAIDLKIHAANTGSSTINIDTVGVNTIKNPEGQDLAAGDLPLNAMVRLLYDGTNFILQPRVASSTYTKSLMLMGA